MRVGVVCNGPGELWGWARPVVRELAARGADVLLWLLSCPYATGRERELARDFSGCRVEGPFGPFTAYRRLSGERVDCVVQLGGDIFWGRTLAKKSPLFCYTYGGKSGLRDCQAVFTAYRKMADDIGIINGTGARVIGDLVRDSLRLDREGAGRGALKVWEDYGGKRVLFLPGSRENIRTKSLPMIREIIEILRGEWEDFRPAVLFSPFARDEELALWRECGAFRSSAGAAMPAADYVVTQPGTNTLEMMICGAPGLVLAPLSFLREIPVSGIGGLASRIPLLGLKIKELVLQRKLSRLSGYVSWPNRLGGAPILDELVGDVSPRAAAARIIESLSDKERLASARNKLLTLSAPADESSPSPAETLSRGIAPGPG